MPLYPGEEALDPSVACNGVAIADLAWAAYADWNEAVRSSQCRRSQSSGSLS